MRSTLPLEKKYEFKEWFPHRWNVLKMTNTETWSLTKIPRDLLFFPVILLSPNLGIYWRGKGKNQFKEFKYPKPYVKLLPKRQSDRTTTIPERSIIIDFFQKKPPTTNDVWRHSYTQANLADNLCLIRRVAQRFRPSKHYALSEMVRFDLYCQLLHTTAQSTGLKQLYHVLVFPWGSTEVDFRIKCNFL